MGTLYCAAANFHGENLKISGGLTLQEGHILLEALSPEGSQLFIGILNLAVRYGAADFIAALIHRSLPAGLSVGHQPDG